MTISRTPQDKLADLQVSRIVTESIITLLIKKDRIEKSEKKLMEMGTNLTIAFTKFLNARTILSKANITQNNIEQDNFQNECKKELEKGRNILAKVYRIVNEITDRNKHSKQCYSKIKKLCSNSLKETEIKDYTLLAANPLKLYERLHEMVLRMVSAYNAEKYSLLGLEVYDFLELTKLAPLPVATRLISSAGAIVKAGDNMQHSKFFYSSQDIQLFREGIEGLDKSLAQLRAPQVKPTKIVFLQNKNRTINDNKSLTFFSEPSSATSNISSSVSVQVADQPGFVFSSKKR